MTDNHPLRAYYATLIAISYLVTVGAVLAAFGKNFEALGVAAAVTGLIGVIKIPSSRTVTVDNPPSAPVPVEGAQ